MNLTTFGTHNSKTIQYWSKAIMKEALKRSLFSTIMSDLTVPKRPIVSLYNEDMDYWDTFELSIGDTIYWMKGFIEHYGVITEFNDYKNPMIGPYKCVPLNKIIEVRKNWI